MREQLLDVLSRSLMDNMGNRITRELANGIATAFNQAAMQIEAMQAAEQPQEEAPE